MELAYLCRMRLVEVLDLTKVNLRRKGSKDNVTLWSPRLRVAVELAERLPPPYVPLDDSRHCLIPAEDGARMRESTVQTAWQRLMKDHAIPAGLRERFTVHDLKAKGITDTDRIDQAAAAGHLDARITARVYDRLPQPVKPSGK